jgi:hypothetical protein
MSFVGKFYRKSADTSSTPPWNERGYPLFPETFP